MGACGSTSSSTGGSSSLGARARNGIASQDIALRSTYNVGLGYQAVAKDDTDLNFSFAGGVRRESFVSAGSETAGVATAASKLRHNFGPAFILWQLDFSPKVGGHRGFPPRVRREPDGAAVSGNRLSDRRARGVQQPPPTRHQEERSADYDEVELYDRKVDASYLPSPISRPLSRTISASLRARNSLPTRQSGNVVSSDNWKPMSNRIRRSFTAPERSHSGSYSSVGL